MAVTRYSTDIKCPQCDSASSYVIDSRGVEDRTRVRRRRGCHDCGHRYTTWEVLGSVVSRSFRLQRSVASMRDQLSALSAELDKISTKVG